MTKRKLLTAISGLALIGVLQGCSSGGLQDGEIQGDEAPPADAATDPVPPAGDAADLDKVAAATPQDGLEQPPPDPNAAPPDPSAAPPDPAAAPPETPPDKVSPPPAVAEAPPVETPPEKKEVAAHDESEYTVHAGDTLMKIAFEHYGDLYKWKEIFELNRDKISNPNSIARGTVLKLNPAGEVGVSRNGEKYLIKSGDTLGTIARDVYGTSSKWKKIWKNNRELIKDPNRIFAGFYLYYTIEDGDSPRVRSKPVAKKDKPEEEPAAADAGGGGGGDAPREPASANAPAATPPAGSGPG